jgi:hypothetical protein
VLSSPSLPLSLSPSLPLCSDFPLRALPGPFQPTLEAVRAALAALEAGAGAGAEDSRQLGVVAAAPFSVRLLRETGAGLALKRVAGSAGRDPGVAERARALCALWKGLYLEASKATQGQGQGEAAAAPVSAPAASVSVSVSAEAEAAGSAAREALYVGEQFEGAHTWRGVYAGCERIERRRGAALGAMLRARSVVEQQARHTAVSLHKAPRPATHQGERQGGGGGAGRGAPGARAAGPVSAGGYQAGRSIRSTMGASSSSAAKSSGGGAGGRGLFGTGQKRPGSAPSSFGLLGRSTKRVKTVVTAAGGVMRMPRKEGN